METPPPLRLEYLDPSQLAEHPSNWKFHPPDQLASIDRLMDRVGWAGALLLNARTGRLLDGHGRKQLMERKGSGPVPVLIGSWDEEQEREILASLDPTGWTAVSDRKKFEALLKSDGFPSLDQSGELGALLESVKGTSKLLDQAEGPEAPSAEREDQTPEITLPPDALFPSDNPFGVPSLLPEMQAESVPFPVMAWGSVGHSRPMPGTWHHYVDDYKFEPLWRRPHRLLKSHPAAVCEPNFSTTDQTPLALVLWHVYRKRWLGRYWQSQGVRLFVDLNVDAAFNAPSRALGGKAANLLGVPHGWKAYSTRAHGNRPEALVDEFRIAEQHAGGTPLFLVVGGGIRVRALAAEHGWAWVPEQRGQDRIKTVSTDPDATAEYLPDGSLATV